MSEIDQLLIRQAKNTRIEAEVGWSKKTICPGYTFDPRNRALGQCGVTRDLFGDRWERLSRQVAFWAGITSGDIGSYKILANGERLDIGDYLTANSELAQYLHDYSGWLSERVVVCEYGHAIEQATGKKLEDHCWARVAVGEEASKATAGMIVELTLDQFNTEPGGQQLPPILVQPANDKDGRVFYHAEQSDVFGTQDMSRFSASERLKELFLAKTPLWDFSKAGDFGNGKVPDIFMEPIEYRQNLPRV